MVGALGLSRALLNHLKHVYVISPLTFDMKRGVFGVALNVFVRSGKEKTKDAINKVCRSEISVPL